MKVDYIPHTTCKTDEAATARLGRCRVSVLNRGLVRIEYTAEDRFLDDPTQSVWFRETKERDFSFCIGERTVSVRLPDKTVVIDAAALADSYVLFDDGTREPIDNRCNLKGTTRTLDMSPDNRIHYDDPATGERRDLPYRNRRVLGDGVASRNGIAVYDDATSLVIRADGTLAANPLRHDYYVFIHKNDYFGALNDLYDITGRVPMLPRYVFGNWWSRYWAYTEEEYLLLLDKFREREIPLSVATLDMDWHYVDIQREFRIKEQHLDDEALYGEWHGWTGFSWNRHLFPDYRRFLQQLRARGLKVTLNLHPAGGIRWFEDCYPAVCTALGRDPADKTYVPFDFTDNRFIRAYFAMLDGYEEDGVDFWWIDWQQGNTSRIPGFDPLWGLNHYHYFHQRQKNRRGLILSRYSGMGSHRYPLGFSGDTTQTWSILRYVIAFTAQSANAGYTFWSHDIGGHHAGEKDNELYIRWLQFALFNPINRLHSASGALYGKEPWNYDPDIEAMAIDILRRRQKFIPYLYTAACRNHFENDPFVKPVYYLYPHDERAYHCPCQYFLGDLLVCPVTSRTDPRTRLAKTHVFLPEGDWTDIYTDTRYHGGAEYEIFRKLGQIPVFAKDGTILYRNRDCCDGAENPRALSFKLFVGNGAAVIYEDDGISENYLTGDCFRTFVSQRAGEGMLTVSFRGEGNADTVPKKRDYFFEIPHIRATGLTDGTGQDLSYQNDETSVRFSVTGVDPSQELTLRLSYVPIDKKTYLIGQLRDVLIAANGSNQTRQDFFEMLLEEEPRTYSTLIANSTFPLRLKQRMLEVTESC